MNHEYVTKGDAAVHAQIRAVPEQSAGIRALDATIRKAAGWREAWDADNKTETACWLHREPLPLKIRIKSTGLELTTGYEIAREKIISGVAELVE
jgi:hypothetical protein